MAYRNFIECLEAFNISASCIDVSIVKSRKGGYGDVWRCQRIPQVLAGESPIKSLCLIAASCHAEQATNKSSDEGPRNIFYTASLNLRSLIKYCSIDCVTH